MACLLHLSEWITTPRDIIILEFKPIVVRRQVFQKSILIRQQKYSLRFSDMNDNVLIQIFFGVMTLFRNFIPFDNGVDGVFHVA
jgi:hypothetical protein